MKITFDAQPSLENSVVFALVYGDKKLSPEAQKLDAQTKGALSRAIAGSFFEGNAGEVLAVAGFSGVDAKRILLLGVGATKELTTLDAETLGGHIIAHVQGRPDETAVILSGDLTVKGLSQGETAAHVALGAVLKSYRFDKYKTQLKDKQKFHLKRVIVQTSDVKTADAQFQILEKIGQSVFFARDLVAEVPNVLNPETYAEQLKSLTSLGVKVEVLDEKQMRELGMEVLLGVGQGSAKESRLVVMQWNGGEKGTQPVAFVGKGVTFDTGGISLKPPANMHDMKWDMGGSAAVAGAIHALASRKAKVNAVGVVGLVENMPDGDAQRPGDVRTSMSGQTVEILNTDAEGRLVLADALWYTQDRFKPQFMIDLATLTGAIITALGHEHAGLFSNDDTLSEQLQKAGHVVGEEVWRLPLHAAHDKAIDSSVADVQNITSPSHGANSITAAQFLQRFVNKTKWAHLDIAGVAWADQDRALTPKGAAGFGVRLLDQLVADYYEAK